MQEVRCKTCGKTLFKVNNGSIEIKCHGKNELEQIKQIAIESLKLNPNPVIKI